ncbi:DsbE family thiol:disulfide interchange protein [Thioalkalivibrio sp. HK1]|uniref:DsbE family thiol:disulfide interchange protein n=1 Tax=Thioalkalivibrio sp. HK1 TaxID=1469245 RepID=UPI00047154F9|nr:DsbE family thiol:disulfide interchange protein [Thioalkalivibrio sp. HK1]
MNSRVDHPPAAPSPASRRFSRWLYPLPVLLFALIALSLYLGLKRDPTLVPSPLVGKTVPEFDLAPVQGRNLGLSSQDLKEAPSLVNIFASWCVACRHEHPLLLDLDRAGTIAIHGINYKDDPQAASRWLDDLGDPYTRTGVDAEGRIGLEWGVYGVPETFLVDAKGRIVYKHIGPLTRQDIDGILLPLIRALDTPSGG